MSDSQLYVTMLKNLRLTRHLELLNVVDDLRAEGLNEHVDLPQLIVCGDQSSGKSSVLAAVSGVPFPKKDNLCTRFATEVVLRRDDELEGSIVSVTITPSSTRPRGERHALESFSRDLSSMEELAATMADATLAMGLSASGSAFSADILRLEVRGPQMPQLTIVDLPGLIHSENKFQSADDIALVNALVEDYMSQERSIILAVVSAKNDYANQIVLTKARKVDPKGRRTLGIITKPDTLHPGSASESSFLGLATNQDIKFSLGWHVVRNQDSNDSTESDRDFIEANFFETSRWKSLDNQVRGLYSLRERLSEVLFEQIKRELPGLITEILVATDDAKAHLARMGRSRATLSEKRMFVMELGQRFHDVCYAACEGLYENSFFTGYTLSTQPRRLRAVVQNASIEFAKRMLETPLTVIAGGRSEAETTSIALRAKTLIHTHRGKELPGTFNPLLVGQLFRELSRQWSDYTREHTNKLWLNARQAVIEILESLTEKHVMDALMKEIVDPELDTMQRALDRRFDDYLQEFRRHPITYNHYLTDTVQAMKADRQRNEVTSRCRQLFMNRSQLTERDIGLIVDTVVSEREHGMDDLAAQQLADYSEAYYKVALKRVIDEVPAYVVEPSILTDLPKLLASTKILEMSSSLIETIGGESSETTKLREALQAKLDVLNRSSLICRVYMDKAVQADTNVDSRTPEESLVSVAPIPDSVVSETLSTRQEVEEQDDLAWPGASEPPLGGPVTEEVELSFAGSSSKKKKKSSKIAERWNFAS